MSYELFDPYFILQFLDGRWEGITEAGPCQSGADHFPSSKKPCTLYLTESKRDLAGAALEPGFFGVDIIPAADLLPLKGNPGGIQISVEVMSSQLIHHHHFGDAWGQVSRIDFKSNLSG